MLIQLLGKKTEEPVLDSKTATENGVYSASDYDIDGFDVFTVAVPATTPVVEPLSLVPSTSSGTYTPSSGVDGFAPVSIAAVTSAIDSNITASNIKSGVTILGVTGNMPEPSGTLNINENGIKDVKDYAHVDVNVSAAAPVIQSLSITPDIYSQAYPVGSDIDGYGPVNVAAVTSAIDSNISAANIVSGVSILGVAGSAVVANETTLSITPSISSQSYSPTSPYTGFNSVTVSAVDSSIDSNIVAENIKSGTTILGVTGNYGGGAPAYCVEKTKDANNKLINGGSSIINLNGCTDLGEEVLLHAYSRNTTISGIVDFSSLTVISGNSALSNTFYSCSRITGANLSSVVTISGLYACQYTFGYCTALTNADLSSLTTISGTGACSSTFNSCSAMTSADLSLLTTISGEEGCWAMFINCTHLASVLLSSLSSITGARACRRMFANTALTSLSFPALTSNSFGSYTNQFNEMLLSVTGCTVHFPSNLQSVIGSWQDVIDGFGGTNTTVLFDLPATE